MRGVEVNANTLSVDVMRDVCIDGPGHYLGHDATIKVMQTEYVYPELADRSSPKEWEENNKPDLLQMATVRKKKILENVSPTILHQKPTR